MRVQTPKQQSASSGCGSRRLCSDLILVPARLFLAHATVTPLSARSHMLDLVYAVQAKCLDRKPVASVLSI